MCVQLQISLLVICSHLPWLSPCSAAVLQCCSRSQPRSHVLAARQVTAGHCVVCGIANCQTIYAVLVAKYITFYLDKMKCFEMTPSLTKHQTENLNIIEATSGKLATIHSCPM